MDTAISTSSLYPSHEEIRAWRDSFEALLNNKLGCEMFRQFVIGEVSSENLEFYLEVEEYKKSKAKGKALQQKAQQIYDTYFKDGVKEVNLDSETKSATTQNLEKGATLETFTLAQNKIEQLMAKDSYRRFIKSKPYQDLLSAVSPPSSATFPTGSPSPLTSPLPVEELSSSARASPVSSLPSRRHTGLSNSQTSPISQ